MEHSDALGGEHPTALAIFKKLGGKSILRLVQNNKTV